MFTSSGPRGMAAIALCVLAVLGCSRSVTGTAVMGDESTGRQSGSGTTVPLPDLLLDPSRFPADYPAVVLDPAAADAALRAIEGVPAGASVTPPECTPPEPSDTAAVTSETPQGTLTVAITRVDTSLRDRRDQLDRCATFTVHDGDTSSTVSLELLPPPPISDDAFAVDRTQAGDSPERALTLVAQHGDVRVLASMEVGEGDDPNTVALDGVFTGAVVTVRGGGQR